MSLFPALIVVAAFAPEHVRNSIIQTITHRAGLSGAGLATVKGAFKSSDDVRKATGFLGLAFTFFYVNSFTSALRRVYTQAWRRPPGGKASGYAVGAAWLVGVAAYFALIGAMRAILAAGPETALFALLALCASIGLWWLTPWLMLQRQVRWRPLIPGAVLTGVGMSVYAASAPVWMPRTVTENQNQFGFFGVALALVTWLTGAGTIIVVSACVAPVLAEDDGWIGRLVRGSDTASTLKEGARPSLPAPLRGPGSGRDRCARRRRGYEDNWRVARIRASREDLVATRFAVPLGEDTSLRSRRDGASVHALEPLPRGHPHGRRVGALPATVTGRRRVVRGIRRVDAASCPTPPTC